ARSLVIPTDREETAGGDWSLAVMTDDRRTYQLLIDDSQLLGLSGVEIGGITWRQYIGASQSWPPVDVTFNSFEVRLSEGVEPSSRSGTFANNIIGQQFLARSGPLTVPANSFPGNHPTFAGGPVKTPTEFGYVVTFDTPYVYHGGNLVVEI